MIGFSRKEAQRLETLLSGLGKQPSSASDVANADGVLRGVINQKLYYAGLEGTAADRFLLKWILSIVLVSMCGLYIALPVALCMFSLLSWLCLRRLDSLAQSRSRLFEKDYTAFLISFAASVRTGLDPMVAFYSCGRLFDSESHLRKELEHCKVLLESGMREEDALQQFGARYELGDVELLRSAVILARKQGASLAACLQRLARVTRQRQSFRRKVKAALAMQRLSAFGISGCAIVIGIFQVITNPEGVGIAFADPIGRVLLSAGVLLMCAGLFWMLQLAKVKE
jgi:tight adherence protein B